MQLRPIGKSNNTSNTSIEKEAAADYPWGTPPGGVQLTEAFDKLMKLSAAAPEHAPAIQAVMEDLKNAIENIKAHVGPMMERQRAAAGGAPLGGGPAPSPLVTPPG